MLSIVGALKNEGGDSWTMAFDGKVEYPWLEANTKPVLELAALNERLIYFLGVQLSSQW